MSPVPYVAVEEGVVALKKYFSDITDIETDYHNMVFVILDAAYPIIERQIRKIIASNDAYPEGRAENYNQLLNTMMSDKLENGMSVMEMTLLMNPDLEARLYSILEVVTN